MTGRPRILFLADAGPAVGGGHVMRCLTLAQALRRAGAECAFVAASAVAGVLDVFADEGIGRLNLADAPLAALVPRTALAAKAWRADAVVVDHYGVNRSMEAMLESRVLVVMDDLRRGHDATLVLDSNLGRGPEDYPGIEALLGPRFALVRPEFGNFREAALLRRADTAGPARLLIALGLTDVGGITARVLAALAGDLGGWQVDVVVGAAAPSLAALTAQAKRDPRIALHIDTRQMAALTARADLAIGAGGSSTWERCCLGLPTITVVLADNQRDNAVALGEEGASLVVFPLPTGEVFQDQLRAAFLRLGADAALRAEMSRAAAALCDGRGADRVAERVMALVPSAPGPTPAARRA